MSQSKRRVFQLPWRSARSIQADVDEELRFDLDMRAAELEREGLPPADARTRAIAEFGDLERTRLYCADLDRDAQREGQRQEWLSELRQDVQFAWRGMRRSPGFVLVVLLTLALGIGANTAAFSIVRKALLDQLPYRDPERVVSLSGGSTINPRAGRLVTPAEIVDLRDSRAFAGVAPFGWYGGMTFVGSDGAEVWGSVEVGGDFFRVLGVRPWLGRAIDPRDATQRSSASCRHGIAGQPREIHRQIDFGRAFRKYELGPHHAHDRSRGSVQLHCPANDARITAESALPQRIAQYHDGGRTRLGVARIDGSAQQRAHAEDPEEVAADLDGAPDFRAVAADEGHSSVPAERRDAGERARAAQVDDLRGRDQPSRSRSYG